MVYILLGNGFEETEAIAPLDLLRRAGVSVQTIGINGRVILGSHGIPVTADILPEEADLAGMEMIVLPGGMGGVTSVRASRQAMDMLDYAWKNQKFVAAICAGPTVLAGLGITEGKNVTCYPGCEKDMGSAVVDDSVACVRDGKLITGASAGCAIPFGLMLVEALKGTKEVERIARQIVIR